MKKYFILFLFAFALFSCKEQTNRENPFKTQTTEQDSIIAVQSIETSEEKASKLNLLTSDYENLKIQALSLQAKKDSLNKLLISTEESVKNINTNKLDKGINGVTGKLNQLKGEKENVLEQIDLQKKEVDIAAKKIILLESELKVYADKRQALYDKGSEPSAFVEVDSLLKNINENIATQKRVVKNVTRKIADREEQVVDIDASRKSLSDKIRSNYTAQEIYKEFVSEEKTRINELVSKIDSELKMITDQDVQLKTQIDALNKDLNQQKMVAEQSQMEKETAATVLADELKSKEKTESRMKLAGVIITVVAFVLLALYFIGKKRKQSKI